MYQPFVSSCRFYGLRATGQNIRYSGVNCALGPSKSIRYSGVRYSGVPLYNNPQSRQVENLPGKRISYQTIRLLNSFRPFC